jgi:CxxC-x17-CxxC domain-containing protein
MYEAVCSTCEEKIAVPFKPDPTRPTFCKECLKDYQRARARAQNQKPVDGKKSFGNNRINAKQEARRLEPLVISSNEKPLTFNQISHMAPKKFQPQRKKPEVNLKEVRSLLNKTIKNADRPNS